jgi:hypothetical protein
MSSLVPNTWLFNVAVNINTTLISPPSFNNCLLIGVLGSSYIPASWAANANIYQAYTSFTGVSADFSPLLATAIAAFNQIQANRIQWLLNAAQAFFAQTPTPSIVYLATIPPQTTAVPNYTTLLTNISNAQNGFYGFTLCDFVMPNTYSTVVADIHNGTGSSVVIPVGTLLTPQTATASYTLYQEVDIPSGGTYSATFYSTDAVTAIPAATFTNISPAIASVTVTNPAVAINGIPGILTNTSGLVPALLAFRTASNIKKLFLDTNISTFAQTIQAGSGSKDMTIFYHSLNLQDYNATTTASLSAASLSEYFTDLFQVGVGLKQLSSMQLAGVPIDPTVTNNTIGQDPTQAGSSINLLGWAQNVFAGFGSAPGLGLVQYGFQSNSIPSALVYLDQIVGGDFIQLTATSDGANYIVSQQPFGGIPYNDTGIQAILNVFKNSMQKAVNQNILMPFTNSNFTYPNFAYILANNPAWISDRIYQGLVFNGELLGRIQRISTTVNLQL